MTTRLSRVVVFGATSAIAAEAPVLYARRGSRLHLVARNAEKLEAVAVRCRREGAGKSVLSTQSADFSVLYDNDDVVAAAVRATGGVDVALVAHGDLGDQLASERAFED